MRRHEMKTLYTLRFAHYVSSALLAFRGESMTILFMDSPKKANNADVTFVGLFLTWTKAPIAADFRYTFIYIVTKSLFS